MMQAATCKCYTAEVMSCIVQGTILPGVTRQSVLQLAESRGYTVEEGAIEVEAAMQADEIFTSGTAVVVCSVGSLEYKGTRRRFGPSEGKEPGELIFSPLMYMSAETLRHAFPYQDAVKLHDHLRRPVGEHAETCAHALIVTANVVYMVQPSATDRFWRWLAFW